MKRSILPSFIKRRSVGNLREVTDGFDFSKENDQVIHRVIDLEEEKRFFQQNYGSNLDVESNQCNRNSLVIANTNSHTGNLSVEYNEKWKASPRRHSSYEGNVYTSSDINIVISNYCAQSTNELATKEQMVDQEDIIALTKHVRGFSDALNNLRNTFKESTLNCVYNEGECKSVAHTRLGEVLKILKEILGKYPPLHSPDILTAAGSIIKKIKHYNYADGQDGPPEYYAAIDQLALSFSSSVHDFLLGDKEMASPNSPGSALDQDDESCYPDDDYDPKFFQNEYDYKDESEDSIEPLLGYNSKVDNDESPRSPHLQKKGSNAKDLTIQRTDELDKTLLSIEGSVELALQRTKVWAKYAKDILTYFERRSHFEAESSKQIAKLAQATRTCIMEECYLPFQSIFVTALENDTSFANNYNRDCQTTLHNIVEKLTQRMKDHDTKRSRIKSKWKNESKKLNESRESLRAAKKLYLQKQKELEKFQKQQVEGRDEKGGFSIGKKKGQEDFQKSAEESELQYKQCVDDANRRQQEIESVKSKSLIELRQLVYQCDTSMKSITIEYFKMMNSLYNPLPVQYRALADSCKNYEEGQQFADFVKLQQSTSNQAMCPTYHFEPYRGEGADRFNSSVRSDGSNVLSISSEDYLSTTPNHPRRSSVNSEQIDRPKQAWGSLPRNKGSATDDTDSLSSRSLPGSPQTSPTGSRKTTKQENELYSDDENSFKEAILKGQKNPAFKNQKLSAAALTHKFRRLKTAAKCKECESYVYFNGNECEKCGLICHKKCAETLAIKCGNKRLPRKMTTFGVDFHQHLAATKRKDIPYIMEKCIETINDHGLGVKGLYRVSGVKSKVEKLCQQFETGGDLVDLSNTPPHFVASVLKLYLRQLPEPLLTFKLYQPFLTIAKDSMTLNLKTPSDIEEMSDVDANVYEALIVRLHETVKKLPSANFYTTAKLVNHLKRVVNHCDENHMSAANLAIVFGPTLLKPEGDPGSLSTIMDMSHQTRAVELLLLNSQIFSVVEHEHDEEGSANKHNLTKNRIETVVENPKEESNMDVSRDFTKEVLFIVDSQKLKEEEKPTVNETRAVLPGQPINDDYDNLREIFDSDLNTETPTHTKSPSEITTRSSVSESTDYETAISRLSSIDSLLSGDGVSFDYQSPIELPDGSAVHDDEQDDDDLWMNQFGKEPLKKTLSGSAAESSSVSATSIGTSVKKLSLQGRLETTTFSFSIGNSSNIQIYEKPDCDDTTLASDEYNMEANHGSSSVKRDSKDTVQKRLKEVAVKATISPLNVGNKTTESFDSTTEHDLIESGNNGFNAHREFSMNISTSQLQHDELNEAEDESELSKSPRQRPTVLPKPKKPLDKKSWTADLIKSKTQKIPEHPSQQQQLKQRSLSSNEETRTSSPVGKKSSVKEIRERFQHVDETTNNSTEKFV